MRNEGEHLTNETLKDYLDQCIIKDIPHIHAFAFIFSSCTGINIEDTFSKTLSRIKKNLYVTYNSL